MSEQAARSIRYACRPVCIVISEGLYYIFDGHDAGRSLLRTCTEETLFTTLIELHNKAIADDALNRIRKRELTETLNAPIDLDDLILDLDF